VRTVVRRSAGPSVTCTTCRAPYRPSLTGWSCPVCDTAAPGAEKRRSRRLADADDRLLAIVLVATIANVLLLAVLSLLVVGAS
jgi:hypothetical protein